MISHKIQATHQPICEFYTFKPTDYAFKHDVNCTQWALSFKIFIDYTKYLIMVPTLSTTTDKDRKYKYSGERSEISIYYQTGYLCYLPHRQDKAHKLNSKPLSIIFNEIYLQVICTQLNGFKYSYLILITSK